ncbi:hypothetical protein NVP1077O_55 [Vibrio phage 1.077.O._10N.261.45.A10]|nr:hypothetical protein NVP1070O_55 [Vibrio phage 1.070.O._10N.261.45.B2]AUR85633.1 hypothetical protein NVP1077O_55 [Vibrio phage 1.077.O._10N.261.45.A10]
MELQTIFNQVCQHLVHQGKAAVVGGDNGVCRYRTKSGLRCAVGYLISDKEYHCDLENRGVATDIVHEALTASIGKVTVQVSKLLSDCQAAHDQQLCDFGLAVWARRMIAIADTHSLIVPKQVRELARG